MHAEVAKRHWSSSVFWNLFLLTLGGAIYAAGISGLAVPHQFISGGVFGSSLLVYYMTGTLSPAIWNLMLNVPVFFFGWLYVGRRFFLYSLYGVVVESLFVQFFHWHIPVADNMLAAIAAGAVCGAGAGIMLRSLGSGGGLDIFAVFLHQRYNLRIGQFIFLFNLVLFTASYSTLGLDRVLFSMVMTFILGNVADHFIAMFNQRKMVLVISYKAQEIADEVLKDLHRGATFLHGRGAFTQQDKDVLMVVVNSIQLKKLEETIFRHDPEAFMVIENTFNVIGSGFSRRKVYS